MITLEVTGRFREMDDIITLTRHIAEVALRVNDRLISENADLKQQLASRPPSRRKPA